MHTGYVAISNGDKDGNNRDIAIVFRGTVEESEWWSDFQPEMVRWFLIHCSTLPLACCAAYSTQISDQLVSLARWNDLQAGEPGRLMLFEYGLPLLKRFTPQQTDSVMVAKVCCQMCLACHTMSFPPSNPDMKVVMGRLLHPGC